MNFNLKDKVAIVTGASAGLGKAIAFSLAQEGAKVAISARHPTALKQTATGIESATGKGLLAVSGDMSKAASVKDLVNRVVAEYKTVHILVNNVGQASYISGQNIIVDGGLSRAF